MGAGYVNGDQNGEGVQLSFSEITVAIETPNLKDSVPRDKLYIGLPQTPWVPYV